VHPLHQVGSRRESRVDPAIPREGSPLNDKVTLFGEVVAVDGEDAQVRLDTDELAILQDPSSQPLHIGYRGEFAVEGCSPEGRTIVAPVRLAGSEGNATAFDLEFDRLHSALSGRHTVARTRAPSPVARSTQEEQIRGWIHHVDAALSQLRKHRARRLNESDES
jgi:hypothetical protein